jgi:hypothetical protein
MVAASNLWVAAGPGPDSLATERRRSVRESTLPRKRSRSPRALQGVAFTAVAVLASLAMAELVCQKCQSPLRLIALVKNQDTAKKILVAMHLVPSKETAVKNKLSLSSPASTVFRRLADVAFAEDRRVGIGMTTAIRPWWCIAIPPTIHCARR